MWRCQRAGTTKNKKVTENFPPASVLVCGLKNQISLKSYIFSLKWVFSKVIFFWVAIILQYCLKIVKEKSKAKICNRKFATFLTPFQANSTKMHPSLTSPHFWHPLSPIVTRFSTRAFVLCSRNPWYPFTPKAVMSFMDGPLKYKRWFVGSFLHNI